MDHPRWLAALERAQIEYIPSAARARAATLSGIQLSQLKDILAGQLPRARAFTHELNLAELEDSVADVLEKLGALSNADAVRIAICAGI